MFQFPLGTILLTLILILVYFGATRRVLDRMHMRDRTAIGLIIAIIVGSFLDIPVTDRIVINLGGVITVGVAVYLWVTSGTAKEKIRSLIAAVITAGVLYLSGWFFDATPEAIWIDPIYLYPLIAGIVGYLSGRSRRGAFFAAVMGILSMDLTQYIYLWYYGIDQVVYIGGAGMFDSLVIAAVLAVLLADFIGETREYLQGGPVEEGRPEELLQNLRKPQPQMEAVRKPFVEPVPVDEYHEKMQDEESDHPGDDSYTEGDEKK